ncbi:MAG: acetyltransferase [Flammeovirgaceae bacterium]|nr:acetyltransferase [Flammeovirgaceae bacterium]
MSRFKSWKKPKVKHNELTEWNWVVQNPENLILEEDCDIGAFTYINAKYGVKLSKGCQLGSHCSVYSISTIDGKEGAVFIGESACIGSHSTIMPGVTIGKNAIVGAHSFVNKDVPDDSVVYGVPAKVVKK